MATNPSAWLPKIPFCLHVGPKTTTCMAWGKITALCDSVVVIVIVFGRQQLQLHEP
jgi:hypothetical protein